MGENAIALASGQADQQNKVSKVPDQGFRFPRASKNAVGCKIYEHRNKWTSSIGTPSTHDGQRAPFVIETRRDRNSDFPRYHRSTSPKGELQAKQKGRTCWSISANASDPRGANSGFVTHHGLGQGASSSARSIRTLESQVVPHV